jgi:lysophospholipase L1-like esterase
MNPSIRVALFGDSLASGRALAAPPVVRLREALPGVQVDDWSVPSLRAIDAADLVPRVLAQTRPSVALLLFGGADVIGRTPPAAFALALRARVEDARTRGCGVVLQTVPRHPAHLAGIQAINAVIWRVAGDAGAAVGDTYALPMGGFVDDGVHPDQASSDACAALLADTVRRMLGRGDA